MNAKAVKQLRRVARGSNYHKQTRYTETTYERYRLVLAADGTPRFVKEIRATVRVGGLCQRGLYLRLKAARLNG